jgi:transmembrane sensor
MKTLTFPNQEAIVTHAATWIAKIDRGLSSGEQAALDHWLDESPHHAEALVQCASVWDMLDILKPISKLMPMQDFEIESEVPEPAKPQGFGAGRMVRYAIAASVAAITAVSALAFLPILEPKSAAPVVQSSPRIIQHYQTGVGETTVFALTDGSLMQLNTDSKVTVEYTAKARHITLMQGEVYVDVAKDPSKPFTVASGVDRVTAVGTAFSVDRRSDDETEVIVTEGTVRVNRPVADSGARYDDLFLTPGQRLLVSEAARPQLSVDDDPESALAWRDGMIVFRGEPLREAIREINRYTNLSFRIVDPALTDIPVGGYFRTGDLDQLLTILEQNFGVASERQDNEILLSRL